MAAMDPRRSTTRRNEWGSGLEVPIVRARESTIDEVKSHVQCLVKSFVRLLSPPSVNVARRQVGVSHGLWLHTDCAEPEARGRARPSLWYG